jgi:hypothetical protein
MNSSSFTQFAATPGHAGSLESSSLLTPHPVISESQVSSLRSRGPLRGLRDPRPQHDVRGRPLGLTEAAVTAFWAWFGKSRAVDPQTGRPLVAYHGTSYNFTEFVDKDLRNGFYFTDDILFANGFAEGEGANVIPVYLAVQRPADLRHGVPSSVEETLQLLEYSRLHDLITCDPRETWNFFDGDTELAQILQRAGYDGMRLAEPEYRRNVHSWVAFSSHQIKSVVGNPGTFLTSCSHLTDGHELPIDEFGLLSEPNRLTATLNSASGRFRP